mmetsp:Transcript_4737/g.6505  ORF Transcript_4737/g.6505 Transcript_4737/m.6505 type:complete len:276 (+) Transcript_4737:59-886(+)|eukprot:CAMPEP_0170085498 /NCGR_PEP_ID=MMETSP0019_2-20121128/20355_1 /TAXON_ID=98059 /ORGANISM="Dinobryon sp., Strain UTEXLB2267" /LENGTH=275 /DNA_ID=CAMNT_0010301967 /DNA_START=59 /DNA_END=883 /DNA_ORIENTATION=-
MGCNFSAAATTKKNYDKVQIKEASTTKKKSTPNPFKIPVQEDFIASTEYTSTNRPTTVNCRCDSDVANDDLCPKSASVVTQSLSKSHDTTATKDKTEFACFGAGCYWGTEKFFKHDFTAKNTVPGCIIRGEVGFMGPKTAKENPTYNDVCMGSTGHVEVYNMEYTGGSEFYEALVRYFFQFHDPTVLNKQGNDRGTQYASVIYCYSDDQKEIAFKVKQELQERVDTGKLSCYLQKRVTTDVRNSTIFYPAHEEHQNYLINNPNGYCNHRMRFTEW